MENETVQSVKQYICQDKPCTTARQVHDNTTSTRNENRGSSCKSADLHRFDNHVGFTSNGREDFTHSRFIVSFSMFTKNAIVKLILKLLFFSSNVPVTSTRTCEGK